MVKSITIISTYCFAMLIVFKAESRTITENIEQITPLTIERIEEILAMNDPAKKLKLMQKYGVEACENLVKFSQDTIKEVDKLVAESENAIKNIKSQSITLNLEEFKFTKNFFANFNEAKLNLLDARRDLVSLASKTILLTNNIIIGIDNWEDEHAAILLKHQFTQLTRLVEETKSKVASAKEKYSALINTWLTIDEDIALFKLKLSRAIDTHSEEYDKWTSSVRAASYSIAGGVTAGMIVADIFGCLGFCSGLVTSSTWAATVATVETAIADYTKEIQQIETQVGNAIIRLGNLDKSTEEAIKLMTNEMNLVITWEAAAKNVERTMTDFTYEQMQAVLAFQNIFKNSVVRLKEAAQNFYDFAISKKPTLQV